MQIPTTWHPTKYDFRNGRLAAAKQRKPSRLASQRLVDAIAAFWAEQLPREAKGRLMDHGCGSSPLLMVYAPLVEEAVRVDWNAAEGELQPDVAQDLNQPLPFPDAQFDVVISSDVLEHLRAPQLALNEIRRTLKPGGVLLLNVPFFFGLHEEPHDYFRYTRHGLQAMLEGAGFDQIHIEVLGNGVDTLVVTAANVMALVPVVGGGMARIATGAAALIARLGFARSGLAKLGERMPMGYGVVARVAEGQSK